MVDDRVATAIAAESIIRNARRGTGPETHVTNNDVVCVEIHLMIPNTDTIAGRRLPRNRDKWILDFYLRLQRNRPGNTKDDGSRPIGRTRLTKTARSSII